MVAWLAIGLWAVFTLPVAWWVWQIVREPDPDAEIVRVPREYWERFAREFARMRQAERDMTWADTADNRNQWATARAQFLDAERMLLAAWSDMIASHLQNGARR